MCYFILCLALAMFSFSAQSQNDDNTGFPDELSLDGLKFRSIGPALTSGRIADIAVHPENPSEYYVATASGGVWKTTNRGTTFQPIFDQQGSYSIGCVTMDPGNPNVIWVGSGENNNQRSVAYGDGLYKSEDGGKSWKKKGLENSEHIGMIAVHPDNGDVVYVAAYGPLWSSGGDRGVYKTNDGGESWERVLYVSEHTGINEVYIDPRNPQIIYATAHQRRRHVWTYISGGPESAIYKSTDGGKNWKKLENGLPSGDKGRIALAFPPTDPQRIYAMIEGHGFYVSEDQGASFSFQNSYNSSGNYYVELIPHPVNADIIYSMDTYLQFSRDAGKNWERLPLDKRHVDDHSLWINPGNTEHMLVGGDGGLYESYNGGQDWNFKANLPITQFYKVSVDNAEPFYNVYGGTQDNFSLAGPSQTRNSSGITNADWYVTNTGDGFETAVDPKDPNIIYAQSQYGGLVRFDKKSGESVGIRPEPGDGEEAYRYNWDAPLLISPHNNQRLYFAANVVFRSDDRGDNWQVISPDLSRKIDRHTLPVMGKIWSVDAIAYDQSTSNYGNIVAMDESRLQENLLYIGTDDGMIHRTEDGGKSWSSMSSFPGVPERTYVNMILTSRHDKEVVFAVFNNHKNGDFKPYILRSDNKGKTWQNISSDLPARGSVYSLAQDHKNADLLFAGTEFGFYVSFDGGKQWKKFSAGLPTIAVRDIAIQERENDIVLATMGRGFYILDDYSPLRKIDASLSEKQASIIDISDGEIYFEASPLGYGSVGFQGASFYAAPNPEAGAIITYYLKNAPENLKSQRQKLEKKQQEQKQAIKYPLASDLREEDFEEAAYLIFVIEDRDGREISRFAKKPAAGVQRVAWDGKVSSTAYLNDRDQPVSSPSAAYFALPGTYRLKIYLSENGQISPLAGPAEFDIKWQNQHSMQAQDKEALLAFQGELEEARKRMLAINSFADHLKERIQQLKVNVRNTPGANLAWLDSLRSMEYSLREVQIALNGDESLEKRSFDTPPSLMRRVNMAVWNSYYTTMAPTGEQRKSLEIIRKKEADLIRDLKNINARAEAVNRYLIKNGAPYLRGELPEMK